MDLEAFQNRVLPLKSKLFRFSMRLLGNEDEAKDIVQEVFTRVWKGKAEMENVRNWEAWCMRIARNLSLDRIRLNHRQSTGLMNEGFDVLQDAPSPHERAELRESMQQVAKIIASLPSKQRQVIHLRDVEGYSYGEICEILELDMNQVKVNLFRARNALREKLIKINAYGL